jgi:hypothetical protein
MDDFPGWLNSTPISRGPSERLMIRLEDGHHDGFWMYVGAAGDDSSDWIHSPAAKRLRASIDRRWLEERPKSEVK